MSPEHGYTLQRFDEGLALYPTLDPKGAPQPGLWWTTDQTQALTFCRKIDAQRFMETFTPNAISHCQVQEILLELLS